MDIAFETEELRQRCINRDVATKNFGAAVAEQLTNRLADLRAADSVHDLVVGLRTKVYHSLGDTRVIELTDEYVLVFVANHLKPPLLTSGKIDWDKVSRVRVVDIGREAKD